MECIDPLHACCSYNKFSGSIPATFTSVGTSRSANTEVTEVPLPPVLFAEIDLIFNDLTGTSWALSAAWWEPLVREGEHIMSWAAMDYSGPSLK